MAWGVETQNLTERIADANKARKEAIRQLRGETRATLAESESERVERSTADLKQMQAGMKELFAQVQEALSAAKRGLAQAESDRAKEFSADLRQMQAGLKELFAQVQEALSGVKRGLAQADSDRVKEFSADLRRMQAGLKELFAQVGEALSGVKRGLAQTESDRANEFSAGLRQMQGELEHLFTRVAEAMAAFKKAAAEAEAERVRDAAAELQRRRAGVRDRLAAVNTILGELRGQREKAAAAWQELAGLMQQTSETPATADQPVPGTVREGQSERVLAYLADHRDGTKLVDLEKEFGVARIQMGRTLRKLMDEGRVEKQGLLYFAK